VGLPACILSEIKFEKLNDFVSFHHLNQLYSAQKIFCDQLRFLTYKNVVKYLSKALSETSYLHLVVNFEEG